MAEAKLATYSSRRVVPAKMIIGSDVVNSNWESLGKIEDLVVDASAGRIAYAVLSFGGFLGMGDKYSPFLGTPSTLMRRRKLVWFLT